MCKLQLRKGKRLRMLLLLKSKHLQKLNSNSLGKQLLDPQLQYLARDLTRLLQREFRLRNRRKAC
jgi:hypothetical protein